MDDLATRDAVIPFALALVIVLLGALGRCDAEPRVEPEALRRAAVADVLINFRPQGRTPR